MCFWSDKNFFSQEETMPILHTYFKMFHFLKFLTIIKFLKIFFKLKKILKK